MMLPDGFVLNLSNPIFKVSLKFGSNSTKLSSESLISRYYFPTYENDALLCTLDDDEDNEPCHNEDIPVIAEDISDLKVLKQNSVLNQLLKNRGCLRKDDA